MMSDDAAGREEDLSRLLVAERAVGVQPEEELATMVDRVL